MSEQHLVCPHCKTRLKEQEGGERVWCASCHREWPNFLKYPVQEAVNMSTGEFKLVNVLTGEDVTAKDVA